MVEGMLPDGHSFSLVGHLSNGINGLDDSQGYVVPKTVDLEAAPAVSYGNGAQNSVAARLQVTRIGGGASFLSNRLSFMLLASRTIDSPSVQFSELNSTTSLVKSYVKVDQSSGSTVVRLNQTQMTQKSMAIQLENRLRALYGDQAPALPYFGHGSRETTTLLPRCVEDAIVHEVVGMVSDARRLAGGDSTGECAFAFELLRAAGPAAGAQGGVLQGLRRRRRR